MILALRYKLKAKQEFAYKKAIDSLCHHGIFFGGEGGTWHHNLYLEEK